MDRQTMLTPIEWTDDDWFKTPEDYQIDAPTNKPEGKSSTIQFLLNDDFSGNALKPH